MLNKEEIKKLISQEKLIEDYINLDVQLTPNGFDLSVGQVFLYKSEGILDFSNSERKFPQSKRLFLRSISPTINMVGCFLSTLPEGIKLK